MHGMNKVSGKPLADFLHLKQSITDILTTPIGSRPMRRDYGSNLFTRIDAPMTGDLIAEIYADVVDALFNYEPRFEVSSVAVVSVGLGSLVLDLEGTYLPTGETVKLTGINIK